MENEKLENKKYKKLGNWKNIELTKWFNQNDKVSYSIKLSYKKNGNWDSKTLTVFPNEVLDLSKAMELIESDMFDFKLASEVE